MTKQERDLLIALAKLIVVSHKNTGLQKLVPLDDLEQRIQECENPSTDVTPSPSIQSMARLETANDLLRRVEKWFLQNENALRSAGIGGFTPITEAVNTLTK